MMEFILSIEEKVVGIDTRQTAKVRYPLSTILFLVFFSQLAGAETWVEIADFVEWNEKFLGEYVDLSEDCPSHDTFERVMGMISDAHFQELNRCFQEEINFIVSKEFNRLISLDGKTMRGNRSKEQSANRIITSYDGENRLSLGQVVVNEKSNEITAIPCLLRLLNLKKSTVTIDAMGTQTDIVKTIVAGEGDYCLAVKGNQGTLFEDISLYFSDGKILEKLQAKGQSYRTVEKARGQIESREYWIPRM